MSTTGNDRWSGNLPKQNSAKIDGPLLSLTAAQEKARSLLKQGESVKVVLREGTYRLTEPLVFTN